ncbi:P-loop containing nucleoside triphosphate hydrolase protein [Nemania sp. FL0031]|nr:P-loop containing nucleoside triphosphate hydrolase protein [Nemania sp. FL0031]
MKSIPGLEFYKDRDYCRVVDFLLATISKLKVENTMLKKDINSMRVSTVSGYNSGTSHENNDAQTITPNVTETSGYEVCHQVDCIHPPQGRNVSYFRDVPMLFKGDTARDHIRGQVQIPNPAKYFEEHTNIEFIVIQVYCCDQSNTAGLGIRSGRLIADSKPTEIIRTKIAIRPSLLSAIKTTMNHHRSHFEGYDSSRISDTLTEPFLFFYIHNKTFVQLSQSSSLEPCDIEAIQLLCSYFEENWRKDWDDADHLFSRGKVNMKHFSKLFHPGEVILTKSRDGQEIITAKQVADYHSAGPFDNFVTFFEWQFNGQFQKVKESYSLRQVMTQSTLSKFNLRHGFLKRDVDSSEQIDDNTEKDITSLPAYPLRFSHDAQRIKDELVSRGLKFWKYRKQTLVCYVDQKVHEENQAERRFMIDYEVFRRIHPKNEIFEVIMDDLGQEVMNQDQPPRDNFLACLPAHIHGYDLSEKTWKLIRVDQTTDVTWNKNIFKQLVLPSHDKELIQAVVTAHGQKMSGTADIIGGKGQGVLLLLHGGPGTGKTLTAEGIAEEQERPLYRVTCGDIGVEPEDVERYLKYVLEIGRAWGCVVLLDEADVFLEERSPADHKRNAVISIFLRVLEYYDGILILTTNRVGSFDEAFKSRIHLSLGYPNLNEEQREQIWGNFFQLLDGKNERFDIQDLKLNVQKLAKHEINGRQIRNAVMIARHLAKFRKQALVYRHVQEAVAAVVKFNEYLQTVKGASDDDFAEYDRLRARIS